MSVATVVLARHGETRWNRAGRIQGWAPTRLTDRGRRQADALGAALAERYGIDRLVCSDLVRARETADRVAATIGVEPRPDRRWRERDAGRLQGFTHEEAFERHPRLSIAENGAAALSERPPGGESLAETARRVRAAFDDLVDGLDRETAVVVTHGGPLRTLLGEIEGLDPTAAIGARSPPNAGIAEVAVEGGEARIVREDRAED